MRRRLQRWWGRVTGRTVRQRLRRVGWCAQGLMRDIYGCDWVEMIRRGEHLEPRFEEDEYEG